MLQKISRQDCLGKYPDFPLRHYNEESDEEDFFYPDVISGRWMELAHHNDEALDSLLATELTKLIRLFGIESLIFLGDNDQPWVTELGLSRKDYQPFLQAIEYFLTSKIDNTFNGGVRVRIDDLEGFLIHFYTIVRCDASLPYFHFIDEGQQILGMIHYSGQIRIDSFTKDANKLLETSIPRTGFKFVERS